MVAEWNYAFVSGRQSAKFAHRQFSIPQLSAFHCWRCILAFLAILVVLVACLPALGLDLDSKPTNELLSSSLGVLHAPERERKTSVGKLPPAALTPIKVSPNTIGATRAETRRDNKRKCPARWRKAFLQILEMGMRQRRVMAELVLAVRSGSSSKGCSSSWSFNEFC